MRLALDSSFIAKLAVDERWTNEAMQVLETGTERGFSFTASELSLVEAGNVVWKNLRRRKRDGRPFLEQIMSLNIEYIPTDRTIALNAMDIAQKNDISYYDAVHVASARGQKAPLITEDLKLLRKVDDAMRIRDALSLLSE